MEHKVEAVMTSQVVTARPSTPFQELVRLLEQHRISALPVTDDNGRLAGIVTRSDPLKVFLRPDPAVRWEVDHDIVGGEARHRRRRGPGRSPRRGGPPARPDGAPQPDFHAVRRVQAVDGVVEVDARLAWRIDDQLTAASRPVRWHHGHPCRPQWMSAVARSTDVVRKATRMLSVVPSSRAPVVATPSMTYATALTT
jgi:CBS domain-containing protein